MIHGKGEENHFYFLFYPFNDFHYLQNVFKSYLFPTSLWVLATPFPYLFSNFMCFYQSVLPFISLSFFLHWIQLVLSVCMWVKDHLIDGNLQWNSLLKKSDTISSSFDKLPKCVVSFWVRNSQKFWWAIKINANLLYCFGNFSA